MHVAERSKDAAAPHRTLVEPKNLRKCIGSCSKRSAQMWKSSALPTKFLLASWHSIFFMSRLLRISNEPHSVLTPARCTQANERRTTAVSLMLLSDMLLSDYLRHLALHTLQAVVEG